MHARPIVRLSICLMMAGPGIGTVVAEERTPRVNYMLNCQGCHLPDGSGMVGKVPSLRGHLANFLRVDGGRGFIVRVPGTANSPLSDADIAALLNWLIPEMGPPLSSFTPFDAEEVHTLRAHRLQDVASTRSALMLDINTLDAAGPPDLNR